MDGGVNLRWAHFQHPLRSPARSFPITRSAPDRSAWSRATVPAGERLFFTNGLHPETVALWHPAKVSDTQIVIRHALKVRVIAFPFQFFLLGLHSLLGDEAVSGFLPGRWQREGLHISVDDHPAEDRACAELE